MGYRRFPKQESVEEKKERANKSLAKLRKKNPDIEPIIIEGRTLAKNWWGKAWNLNLEGYADYENRIGRGKSYVRNNMVLDLKITKGKVSATVQGSRAKPYDVEVVIDALEGEKWEHIITLCNHRIDSLEQLIEGKFPEELEVLFKGKGYGLFPSPKEIHFDCSCPDWASMCKHVAAVLYGIGTRLDADPMLFFELRDIDSKELVKKSVEQKLESMLKNAGKKSKREIAGKDIADIFGL